MKLPLLLLGFAASLGGCVDQTLAPVSAPAPASIATLSANGSLRQKDAVVTFTARLNASASAKRAGAYAARVEYDPSVVSYVGEGDATSGLVAFNARDGVLKVAGASLDGYTDGVLFNAKFRVTRVSPTAEVRLVIDELRDVSASDRLPAATPARSSSLRPWK